MTGAPTQFKSFIPEVKDVDGSGSGQLVVATLNVIDKDGDVTRPGFFGRQHVAMVPTHNWSHVPIGKGVLYERGPVAVVDFKMNLSIESARDWYEALKFDLENPPALQEYSYGFQTLADGSTRGELSGRKVKFLHARPDGTPGAKVFEVSPLLRAAGIGTRTLSLAGATVPTPDPELAKQYARFVAATHGVHLPADDAKTQYLRFIRSMHNTSGARR